MSKWVVEAISLAYESAGQPSPLAVRARSTRSMAASKALLSGVSLSEVCDATGWSSPCRCSRPLCARSHMTVTCSYGDVGIRVPTAFDAARSSLERERLGYVCNPSSLIGNETLRRSAILPAFPLSAPSGLSEADALVFLGCFIVSWSMTSPAYDVPSLHWADSIRAS
jgi:hypothetical protein